MSEPAFIITAILFTQFTSSSVTYNDRNPFIYQTSLCSSSLSLPLSLSLSLSLLMLVNAEEKEEYHPLLYNINLYYNQSNSLRIKRDIFPALQNKWSYVNTMHQCDILFDLRRKCNIIIYVVLLALKAYRPFSRIAKSNIYPNINRQHANTMRYHSDFFSLTHTLAFASNCFFCLSPDFFFFFN